MKLFQVYLHLLLLLSLTTSITIPRYAKPDCKYTCGGNNVTIPFPFGIGAGCSVNKWYTIHCYNSKPYLSNLNNLEVLRVNLSSLTVTVNTPKVSYCQNPVRNSSEIRGVDLDGSPFLFSKLNNKFVFEGCGNAIMVMDNRSMLTGCSTTCGSDTLSNRNNCFGISCCQTTIPDRFMSYSISLTSQETPGENGGCRSSAALVDKTSYDEGRVSVRDNSSIPISLVWTLKDSDQVTCCYNRPMIRRKVALFNGTPLDTRICYQPLVAVADNPYLEDGCDNSECGRCTDSGGYCKTISNAKRVLRRP